MRTVQSEVCLSITSFYDIICIKTGFGMHIGSTLIATQDTEATHANKESILTFGIIEQLILETGKSLTTVSKNVDATSMKDVLRKFRFTSTYKNKFFQPDCLFSAG